MLIKLRNIHQTKHFENTQFNTKRIREIALENELGENYPKDFMGTGDNDWYNLWLLFLTISDTNNARTRR